MYLVTDVGLFLLLSALITYLIATRRYTELLLMTAACLLSLEAGYLMKKLFQIPRPDHIATQLTYVTGWTFPSIHAAVGLSILPFIQRLFKNKTLEYAIGFFIITIAASRIYLGVHYLSDVLFGGLIGYLFGWIIISLEDHLELAERFIYHITSKLEVRRQMAHLVTGLLIVLLIKLRVLNVYMLGAVLVGGGTLALISRYKEIPYVYDALRLFERPEQMKRLPGKGPFFLVLGSLLALIFFEEPIALAAISIMAVGDSLTTLVGIYYGRIKSPTNPLKHLEGTVLAIIAGTIVAFNFVPFEKAFLGAFVAMSFEALTIRHIDRILDDNLLIPLVAGVVMSLIL